MLNKNMMTWMFIVTVITGCNDNSDDTTNGVTQNPLPDFVHGTIYVTEYDGISDDLLTAGYGQSGVATATPSIEDPAYPTIQEIRTNYITWQYPAIYDVRPAAGWGTLFGPAVPTRYAVPDNDGKVAGREYLAHADDGSGRENVNMLVKVPDNFNPNQPCILAFTTGGTANADQIATADWGLKNGCAVSHTDKGGGNHFHDLSSDIVVRLGGTLGTVTEVGSEANFVAQGTESLTVVDYAARYPYRIAIKHAHSGQNPEAKWGYYTLQALEFAFYILNRPENNPANQTITPENTLVIAAGVSNGGGAILRAVEQDSSGLIDGAVVILPNINPHKLSPQEDFTIRQGDTEFSPQVHGRQMLDYLTYQHLYQPCASADTLVNLGTETLAGAPGRCSALYNAGLLHSRALPGQIAESQSLLNRYGFLHSANPIAHVYNASLLQTGLISLYANGYGRFSVVENLCGYSYAHSLDDGPPLPKTRADLADDYFSGLLSPPLGLNLITNRANDGMGQSYLYHTDTEGNADQDLAGALCLRQLVTGTTGITTETGDALTGERYGWSARVRQGMAEITGSGDLQGKPVIIVHGRDDALLPVNFTSRSYYGLNQTVEGSDSKLAYIEVKNANHIDPLGAVFGDTQVPILPYLNEGLDRVYAYLTEGKALPVSQVIPTVPLAQSGGTAVTREVNLPYIDSLSACPITFRNKILEVPEC